MNAIALYTKEGKDAHVWACGKCRICHPSQERADACCDWHCEVCGTRDVRQFWNICQPCLDKKEEAKEKARFEKATKLTPEQYTGWVYREGHGDDGFAESWEDMSSRCWDDGCHGPDYVWACTPKSFVRVHLDRVLQDTVDEAYEGFELEDLRGVDALEAAIQAFEKANETLVSYSPDFSRAIVLPPRVCEACGGDGVETCTNPDHGFIAGVGMTRLGSEIGRLGCPWCGHHPDHKIEGSECPECHGTGMGGFKPKTSTAP